MFKRISEQEIEVAVHLTPGASREIVFGEVLDEEGEKMMKVSVFAHAENNKANDALIKLLSKYFDVPKTNISIKSGQKSRKKIVRILGASIKT